MLLDRVFDSFVRRSPVSVMVRGVLEHALAPEAINELFDRTVSSGYTRQLLFSSLVDLMGVVVTKIQPSVHAAYQEMSDSFGVSLTSVYNKLNGLETTVSAALVRHTSEQLEPVIRSMGGHFPSWISGYRVRILDGNHLAATERRLEVLRGSQAGPLPGQCLVVLEPEVMLGTEVIPCEDGHAQERSLTDDILALVQPKDVWVGDRNFCTIRILFGIAQRGSNLILRHHGSLPYKALGPVRKRGRIETGTVFEQRVEVTDEQGHTLSLRRITVVLDKPTRDGDREIHVLSNLSVKAASAKKIAEVYRKRWTLETMFAELTRCLCCELNTMGYPRAALFGFCVAVTAYNVLSTVKAALRAQHGHKKIEDEVSDFYLANQIRITFHGMSIAIPDEQWTAAFGQRSTKQLGGMLKELATHVRLSALRRHQRGPKKPVPKRTKYTTEKHVSTARLLARSSRKISP